MSITQKKRIGVLTSGGDAPGMNAAVRAVVRSALHLGMEVYAIYEGYQGMVDGNECQPIETAASHPRLARPCIHALSWDDVGGILHRGGTIIGTARCLEFRTHEGRVIAARNLLIHGIDALVVIGGDGSLTGADLFRQEWPQILTELAESGKIDPETIKHHPYLTIVGLPASIDNDMCGSDMTIGTDTALHRITEAIDAISSTAASHQRTFVVEVMGRNCGYLALMGALATGADWVFIPECPPSMDDWQHQMCEVLNAGRDSGRRDSIVIVAEGARDRQGNPITCDLVKKVLDEKLNEDTRITILGHVQRGGAPTAFDRNLSTMLGHAAVEAILGSTPHSEPLMIGIQGNRICSKPLMQCVRETHAVADAISQGQYDQAMEMRGSSFKEAFYTLNTLMQAKPSSRGASSPPLRLAVLNCDAAAPGMNTVVRAAVRLGIDKGHTMLGIERGFRGFIEGKVKELNWLSVRGMATTGGSELGTSRRVPQAKDFYAIARHIEENKIQGLLVIGGWSGYEAAYKLFSQRDTFPAFNIPIVCLPASIDNNLPGSELSIGADTALNNIIEAVDKIKQSAVASNRCFIVEVMGRYCGYLALMSGLATGAEQVYLHEDGLSLGHLQQDLRRLIDGFNHGKRVGLVIFNEDAHQVYNSNFISSMFAEEGKAVFQVRQAILGHLQQGGDPSPFDRIQGTRFAAKCLDFLIQEARNPIPGAGFIGLQGGHTRFFDLGELPRLMDMSLGRPKQQWWMALRDLANILSMSAP